MELVEKKTISMVDAHFWVVLNNVPPGFKFRRATLINKGYPKRQIDQSLSNLSALNLVRETKINLKNIQYEAIDLQKEWLNLSQTMSQNGTNYVPKRDTNKTISKNINNGDKSPKESPAPAPFRGSLNIDHLIEPGPRRKRLEDALERMIGLELMPSFFTWLEADLKKDAVNLPIRAYTKKRKIILELATNYLSLVVMGDRLGETTERIPCS